MFGVRRIEYALCSDFAVTPPYVPENGTKYSVQTSLTTLEGVVSGKSVLSVEMETKERQRITKAELEFVLTEEWQYGREGLWFVVTTNDGDRYMLGSGGRPRCMLSSSWSSGASATDGAGCRYKVSVTQPYPLVRVF